MLHLSNLKEMMASDSELILETLIVDGDKGYSLIPEGRYANMRNVHCLPSTETLKSWLIDSGYRKYQSNRYISKQHPMNKEKHNGLVIILHH